jgi:hypothetical protein
MIAIGNEKNSRRNDAVLQLQCYVQIGQDDATQMVPETAPVSGELVP